MNAVGLGRYLGVMCCLSRDLDGEKESSDCKGLGQGCQTHVHPGATSASQLHLKGRM